MLDKPAALFSMCFLGVPCRYHGKSVPSPAKFARLSEKFHLVPVCPEQLGGLPTPRPACPLRLKRGKTISDLRGRDFSKYFIDGAAYALEIALQYKVEVAFLAKGSPSCDRTGFLGELLESRGITVRNL